MIPRRTLEIAAFWAQSICIECETIQPPEDAPNPPVEGEPIVCCNCGAQALIPAETVLQVADLVGEDE